jgi:hypothetical protein
MPVIFRKTQSTLPSWKPEVDSLKTFVEARIETNMSERLRFERRVSFVRRDGEPTDTPKA